MARTRVKWLLGLSGQMGSDLNVCLDQLAILEEEDKKRNSTETEVEEKATLSEVKSPSTKLVFLAASLSFWLALTSLWLASWCYSNCFARRRFYRMLNA